MKYLASLLLLSVLWTMPVHAADFPERPIRIVTPFPPGGTTDIIARTMAARLTERMGVPVVVENRPGASGIIGTDYVARSPADGYTLLMGGSPHGINNSLRRNVPYNPVTSFAPVSLIGTVPLVLVVPRSMPVTDYAGFTAYARANPDSLKCGVVQGAANHLATELFRSRSGVSILQVPYPGDAPMITDLTGGHINCLIVISTQVLGHISEGRLRALAVTSSQRLAVLPDVPTFQQLGLVGFDAGSWNGVFAPAGTPRDRIDAIAARLIEAAGQPDVIQSFDRLGIQIQATGPDGLGQFLQSEIEKWQRVIDEARIVVE